MEYVRYFVRRNFHRRSPVNQIKMSQKAIHRVTLFKIPKEEDRDTAVERYRILKQEAVKDGKPYILAVDAGKAFPDQRSQGYTIVAKTTFASKEDMDYYDTECQAHKNLKATMSKLQEGVLTAYFESIFDGARL